MMCDDEVTRCFGELPLRCVPGALPLAAHYQFRLSHLKGHLILGTGLIAFFLLINMATLKHRGAKIGVAGWVAHVGCRVSPLPTRPHLCHNVGISHIEVIRVKFTAVVGEGEKW